MVCVTPLAEHMRQRHCLELRPGQCLLWRVSSLPMLVEAGAGLPTGMDGRGPYPDHASISLIRVRRKSLWNFLPTTWRCNCWQWPDLTGGKRAFLSTSMFGGWPCSYWPTYPNCHRAPHDGYNPPQLRLYHIPMFIAIIAFSGWIVNVCQEAHVSLVLPHHSHQVTPVPYSKSPRFSLSVLGLRSLGMPFLCSLTVPQQKIFFCAKSSYRSGEEKELSMYSLWPNPSTPLVRLVTVAWVAVRCCATLSLSLPR